MGKESIEKLLESKTRVSELHQAAILLRELANVERFISSDSDENDDLIVLILPDWKKLESSLILATSVDDILESESEIHQMTQIIDISSRISKSVEIFQSSGTDSSLVDDWKLLLGQIENANSVDEILKIVLEFDQ